MSKDSDNIVKLRPDLSKPESFDKATCDAILVRNRDEMLEYLDGIRGRVMAYDIRGIVMIGFASSPDQDVTFQSTDAGVDIARTVGALEFLKQGIIHDRLSEIEYEEE